MNMVPSQRIKTRLSCIRFVGFFVLPTVLLVFSNKSKAESLQQEAIDSKYKAEAAAAKAENARLWPELSLVMGYGEQNELHEDAEKGALGYLQFDWNIFEGGAGLQRRKASQIELNLAEIRRQQATAKLYKSIKQLQMDIEYLKELRKIEDRELELYKKQYQAAEKRVQTGVTSGSDLLEIKLNQFETETHLETLLFQLKGKEEELQALGDLPQVQVIQKSSFEETFSAKALSLSQEVFDLEERQSLALLLPEINIESKYGQITPQPLAGAKQDEYHLGLYLTWSLFGGDRTLNHYGQQKQKAKAEVLVAKANERSQRVAFQNLLRERTELERLINIQNEILNRAKKLNAATAEEFRRGVKSGGDWLEATAREIAAEKKLLDLRTTLNKKELEIFTF